MLVQENEVLLLILELFFFKFILLLLLLMNNHIRWTQMSLTVTKDSNATLKYFQQWQRMINPGDDTHPNHHDCAILITKYS